MKDLSEKEIAFMVKQALLSCEKAYAQYSGYSVGACLLAASGEYYHGANMENASYGGCICAERTAIVAALYAGERNFRALCVAAKSDEICLPCGICRQFYSEFCEGDMPVICANVSGEYEIYAFSDLMPKPFEIKK